MARTTAKYRITTTDGKCVMHAKSITFDWATAREVAEDKTRRATALGLQVRYGFRSA